MPTETYDDFQNKFTAERTKALRKAILNDINGETDGIEFGPMPKTLVGRLVTPKSNDWRNQVPRRIDAVYDGVLGRSFDTSYGEFSSKGTTFESWYESDLDLLREDDEGTEPFPDTTDSIGYRFEPNALNPLTGAEIVLEAHELINGDRASAYGHPLDDYEQVTAIFYALTGIRMSAEQGQLFMKSVKLTRLVNNLKDGVFHRDSAVDDIGYMGTLGKTAQKRAERGEKMQWFFHND